jgi:hypothetical protein
MTIARELVSALERLAARTPLPPVRALHLAPPSADGTRAGEFCALELEDGTLGLSYVLLGDTIARLRAGAAADVRGAGALEVARWYAEREGADRVLGFAAVNALTAVLFDRSGFTPEPASDTIGELAPGPADHVGMIGLFPPLVPRILATGARLTVVELDPRLAGEHDGWRVTLDPEALRECGKVLSTSTVLLNDTIDAVAARCAGARLRDRRAGRELPPRPALRARRDARRGHLDRGPARAPRRDPLRRALGRSHAQDGDPSRELPRARLPARAARARVGARALRLAGWAA